MSLPFRLETVQYTPSFKTKKKNKEKSNIVSTNTEGRRYIFLPFSRSNISNQTLEQLVLNTNLVESYKQFIHDRILNVDDTDFLEKLAANGYGDSAIYTWILKSKDPAKKTINTVTTDTPVSLYMTKIISPQEVGTLHRDLNSLHPRDSTEQMPVIGAGELKVVDNKTIEFNLLSGTYMEKMLKGKPKVKQEIIQEKILSLFSAKLEEKGITATFNENKDLVEGTSFLTPKETMNILRSFFKGNNRKTNRAVKNNKTQKNKSNKSQPNLSATGAGAGQGS